MGEFGEACSTCSYNDSTCSMWLLPLKIQFDYLPIQMITSSITGSSSCHFFGTVLGYSGKGGKIESRDTASFAKCSSSPLISRR